MRGPAAHALWSHLQAEAHNRVNASTQGLRSCCYADSTWASSANTASMQNKAVVQVPGAWSATLTHRGNDQRLTLFWLGKHEAGAHPCVGLWVVVSLHNRAGAMGQGKKEMEASMLGRGTMQSREAVGCGRRCVLPRY
jgi:hypothetical protein